MIVLPYAIEAAQPPIVDWQPFTMQRTPDGGLFDRTSARRSGDVVNAWVRLVNVHLKGVNEVHEQTDLRMELDCRRPLMRIVAYRVVGPDGITLKDVMVPAGEAKWQPTRVGMRAADVRVALCGRVR